MSKLNTACYAIRYKEPFMTQETLRVIYFCYVHSILTYDIICWGKSSYYDNITNGSGPKTDPWGAPSVIFSHAEKLVWLNPSPEIWTLIYLLLRYDSNYDFTLPLTP